MKAVVINLDHSRDRRELMQRTLTRLGIEFEFLKGIDASRGEHLAVSRYDEQASILDHGMPLTPGEIGCFASHYRAWQQCVRENRPLLVMEDDLIIEDRFTTVLPAVADLVNQLGIIRLGLGSISPDFEVVRPLGKGLTLIRYAKRTIVAGTLCYVLSPKGAAAFLAHAEVWSQPVDFYMNCYTMHGLDNYSVQPLFIKHADQDRYPRTIGDRSWSAAPQLSSGAKFKREILRMKRDKSSVLFQLRYALRLFGCIAANKLGRRALP